MSLKPLTPGDRIPDAKEIFDQLSKRWEEINKAEVPKHSNVEAVFTILSEALSSNLHTIQNATSATWDPGPDMSRTIPKDPYLSRECSHVWKNYFGLVEAHQYCENCKEKREIPQ